MKRLFTYLLIVFILSVSCNLFGGELDENKTGINSSLSDDSYYPLKLGNYWIYKSNPLQSNSPLSSYKMTVIRINEVNGHECFEVGSVDADTGEAQTSRWIGQESNGVVFDYALGTEKYILTEWEPPHVVLPATIVDGLSWENRIKGYNEAYPDSVFYAVMTHRIEGIHETVTVPVGTFHYCLKIRVINRNYEGDVNSEILMYYARGVGRVLVVHEKPGQEAFRVELIEFGNNSGQ